MAEQTKKREFIEHMKGRLDELDEQLGRLEKKYEEASAEARREYRTRLDEMKEQRRKLKQRMDKMVDAGEKQWQELREQTEKIWDALEHSFNYFRSHFK